MTAKRMKPQHIAGEEMLTKRAGRETNSRRTKQSLKRIVEAGWDEYEEDDFDVTGLSEDPDNNNN